MEIEREEQWSEREEQWRKRTTDYMNRRRDGNIMERKRERLQEMREKEERKRERESEGDTSARIPVRIISVRMQKERKRWEGRTEEWLCDAAIRGDVESLKEIIEIDNYILDKVKVGSFKGKNPLHVAISTGQKEFVLELLEINEDLAKASDPELGAALHVASSEGHLEIVELLVEVSPEMCLARDRDGYNPLHIAAMKGEHKILEVLLRTRPQAARVTVDRGENILHLCVNYNQLESLKLLLEKIKDEEFVNSTDSGANNILHLAVLGNQLEMVKLVPIKKRKRKKDVKLVPMSNSKIDVNAKNKSGRTALDFHFLVEGNPTGSGIQEFLLNAGAQRSELTIAEVKELEPKWQAQRRNALMVVASLISTMLFQVAVNPPGGVFQDNSVGVAGKSIFAYNRPPLYCVFMFINTFGLLASLATVIQLVYAMPEPERSHRKVRAAVAWFAVVSTAASYVYSVGAISPDYSPAWITVTVAIGVTVVLWFGLMSNLLGRSLEQKESNGGHGEGFSRSGRETEELLPNAVGGNQSNV